MVWVGLELRTVAKKNKNTKNGNPKKQLTIGKLLQIPAFVNPKNGYVSNSGELF